jgi:hypothetical protein
VVAHHAGPADRRLRHVPVGQRLLLLAADGGLFAFGDAKYLGRDPSTKTDAVRLITSVTG